jgi:hypothetical protein
VPVVVDGVQEAEITLQGHSQVAQVVPLSLEMVSPSQYPLVQKEFMELSHENIFKDVKRFKQML